MYICSTATTLVVNIIIIIIIIISEYLHGIEASVTDKINLQNMMQKLLPYLSCKNVRPVIIIHVLSITLNYSR